MQHLKYGIPYKFKTDKRTVFEYKRKGSSLLEEDTFTQFSYACSQLGIALETSSVPEFKPRVERVFQTLQMRLIVELRLAGITAIDEANNFLKQYITKFNEQFGLYINHNKSVFEKQFDNKLYATVNDNIFALEEIPELQALSENFDEIKEVKPKKVYIQRMEHTWKRKLFEAFLEKQEHRFEMIS